MDPRSHVHKSNGAERYSQRSFESSSAPWGLRRVAMTALYLARLQFASTSIFHFFFVPVTIGLSFLMAVLHTIRCAATRSSPAPSACCMARRSSVFGCSMPYASPRTGSRRFCRGPRSCSSWVSRSGLPRKQLSPSASRPVDLHQPLPAGPGLQHLLQPHRRVHRIGPLRTDRPDRGHRAAAARRLHLLGWAFVVFRHRLAVPNTTPPSARPDERKTDVHGRR